MSNFYFQQPVFRVQILAVTISDNTKVALYYFQHPVCWHVWLHPALLPVYGPGAGTASKWTVCPFWPLGRWQLLSEDQDPGWLLLLRERSPWAPPGPRPVLCGDGTRHDWCYIVSRLRGHNTWPSSFLSKSH